MPFKMISVRASTHAKLIALKKKTNLSLATIIALSVPSMETTIIQALEKKEDINNVINKDARGSKK